MRRRGLLASLAGGTFAGVAGCADRIRGRDQRPTTHPDYDSLSAERVYLSEGVSLKLPDEVPRADTTSNASLVILPGSTEVTAATGIGWLAAGTGVAFVGTEGQATLVEWVKSDAYAETFQSRGFGVGSPPPDFLVAFGVDHQYVSTHSYTWNDTSTPDNNRYLSALNETVAEVETLTART